MPQCPACGEPLFSHAGRGGGYYHRHVVDGPYPNPQPHSCHLVNKAFTISANVIEGSEEARRDLVETIHGGKNKMSPIFRPRNDFVLVRIVEIGKTPSGIAIPEISVQGKKYVVEAVGPTVEDLEVGDTILMTGQPGTDYSLLPANNNLLVIREGNIVLVIEEETR